MKKNKIPKKLVALILTFAMMFVFATPAFALTMNSYEPYTEIEFPKWSLDLRRAESLFFGGIPIAFPLVTAAYSIAGQSFDFMPVLGISCAVSAVIVIIDYIIGATSAN